MLLLCTAGSGSAEEGAAVVEAERCKLSTLAVLLELSAQPMECRVRRDAALWCMSEASAWPSAQE